MILPIETAEADPDLLGELLRAAFFVEQDDDHCLFGCYSTFEPHPSAQRIPFPEYTWRAVLGADDPGDWLSQSLAELRECFERRDRGEPYSGVDAYMWHFTTGQSSDMRLLATWRWDGDGTLVFRLPDGSIFYNTDCKKNHGWKRSFLDG